MSRSLVLSTVAAVATACLFAGPGVAQESSAVSAEQADTTGAAAAGAPIVSSSVALRTASGAESPSFRSASAVGGNLAVATPSVRVVEDMDLYRDPNLALRGSLYYPRGRYFYTGEKTKGASGARRTLREGASAVNAQRTMATGDRGEQLRIDGVRRRGPRSRPPRVSCCACEC